MTILLIESDEIFAKYIVSLFPNDEIVIATSLNIAKTILSVIKPVLIFIDSSLSTAENVVGLSEIKQSKCPIIDYTRKDNYNEQVVSIVKDNINKYRAKKQRFSAEEFKEVQACIIKDRRLVC
jgi:response regulator of citrate/malate metabolism